MSTTVDRLNLLQIYRKLAYANLHVLQEGMEILLLAA